MTSKSHTPSDSLNLTVGAAIAAWAGTFALVHGPFVLGYLAMHAATTGVFLFAIQRSDRNREKQLAMQPALTTASTTVKRPATRRATRTQPAA